jgi:hypothetical protein
MAISVRTSTRQAIIQNGSYGNGESVVPAFDGACMLTIGMHFPLNTAHGRGSSHWNKTPVVNAQVQDMTTAYKTMTNAL